MRSSKKIAAWMLAAAMATGLLAGCGGSSGNETTAAASAAEGTTAASTATDKTGDYSDKVITYGLTTAWDTVNPYGSTSGSIYQNLVCDKLYDRLAFIEEAGSGVSPRAAKSWESADDGKAAIFHLDENAKWHDGQPVTAKDWVFTAQLITNPKFDYGLRSEFNTWAGTDDNGLETAEKSVGVEAVDDYTLKISFKNVTPVEDWLILHNKYFYVLPEHLLGDIAPEKMKDDEFWKAPIGSGPCTFISELSGSQLELGSFADYQLGAPQFGKLILKVIASTNTITSIAAGEMDGFYQQPTTDDALAAKDMGLTVTESSEPTFVGVFLINNQNVSDKRIRQAMSYAIDKDLLIEQNLQGKGIAPATCVIPGSEYDCGLTWSRDVDGTYDLGICGSTAMSYPLWMSGYYDNKNATYCQITDTAYAELQDKIAAETDEAKKKELVNEYQQLLWDEMPLVMLYNGYTFGVQSERFQGYNAFEGGVNNQAVWKWSVKE